MSEAVIRGAPLIKYLRLLTAGRDGDGSDLFDGIDLDRPRVPVVFHTSERVAGEGECIEMVHRLLVGRTALLERLGRRTTLALVHAEEVDEIIDASHDCVEPPAYVVCGVGPVCEAEEDYRAGADAAQRAATTGASLPARRTRVVRHDAQCWDLLTASNCSAALVRAARLQLAPLFVEANRDGLLLTTLRTVLQAPTLSAAAAELFIHHSTLRYRMAKIEKLLEVSLDAVDVRFELQVALRLIDLGSGDPSVSQVDY